MTLVVTLRRWHESTTTAWRDLTYAARQFRRTPVFTIGVVLTLGFGIGASATVYSWMSGVVLRPLPVVRNAETLITVRPNGGTASGSHSRSTPSGVTNQRPCRGLPPRR